MMPKVSRFRYSYRLSRRSAAGSKADSLCATKPDSAICCQQISVLEYTGQRPTYRVPAERPVGKLGQLAGTLEFSKPPTKGSTKSSPIIRDINYP